MRNKLILIAGVLVVSAGVWACIGSMVESVHFNSSQPDFGTPPPPVVITVWGEDQDRVGATQDGIDGSAYAEPDEATQAKLQVQRKAALQKEVSGDFDGAISGYEEFLKGGPATDSEEIIDRIEVMREAKTATPLVMSYLSVQRTLCQTLLDSTTDSGPKPEAVKAAVEAAQQQFKQIANDPVAGFLKPHAQYALAMSQSDNHPEAIRLYREASQAGGPRKERALIMAARLLLAPGDVPDGKSWEDAGAPPEANIVAAQQVLETYLHDFPTGRYAQDAHGLQGRVLYLHKQYPEALAVYLHQLSATSNPENQAKVLSSIKAVLHHLTTAQAKEVEAMIVKDPALLEPYLDFRLYHTEANPADMKSLLAFAGRVQAGPGAPSLSGAILARMAEIDWLLQDTAGALAFADRSLAADGGRKDLAHYIRASCLWKAGSATKAIDEYQAVLQTPDTYLAAPARENLALAYERSSQWNSALEAYWKLDYSVDVAYLLDVRMTPTEIQQIIDSRGAKDEHHDLLVYSLGMRYLRLNQLEKARTALSSIPVEARNTMSKKGSRDYAWVDDDKASTVDTLYDPVDTTNDLIKLEASVSGAQGAAKAAPMYNLATYYYTHRNLMLYNPALWDGGRNWMLGNSWNEKAANAQDTAAVQTHHFEHEALYHARQICLSIVTQYPHSPLAAKALYRAATATRRLANFNEWWRSRNKTQDMYKEAAGLLTKLATAYPADPLAKNAKKYAKVFLEEGKGEQQLQMFGRR